MIVMENGNVERLVTECKRIQEDSTYTAEVHHIMSNKLNKRAFWCKLIPASITVLTAFTLLVGSPNWVAWVTLLSGAITMLNIFMSPQARAREHLIAAKNFTVLKHESRSLHESFRGFLTKDEFFNAVRLLREKYNLVVQFTPPTDDKNAFEEARQRIKEGVHQPDFE